MTGRRAGWLASLAANANVPVFIARGPGCTAAAEFIRASPRLQVVDSPREATVLVILGRMESTVLPALQQVHDQLAGPRATVWWTGKSDRTMTAAWPGADIVTDDEDVVAAIVAAHREVLTGDRLSDSPLLPNVDPAPWRGVGPYGHGGTGMTGGVPYGRPMAVRADDLRDGLTLDVVPVWVGPFFPAFPAGLLVKVTFAGDVVHAAALAPDSPDSPDSPGDPGGLGYPLPDDAMTPYAALAVGSVAIADVEIARARHHLRWLAHFLRLYGLDALSLRVAMTARSDTATCAPELAGLRRRLDRPWVLGRATAGVGVVTGPAAAAWAGPVARSAGVELDARMQLSSYQALNFAPVVHSGGDVRDRWRQRLDEALQSLDLARRAGDVRLEQGTPVELPTPPLPADFDNLLPALITGAEWGDAVATIASLDLNLQTGATLRTEPAA